MSSHVSECLGCWDCCFAPFPTPTSTFFNCEHPQKTAGNERNECNAGEAALKTRPEKAKTFPLSET